MAAEVPTGELELTIEQQEAVRRELAAILAHPSFRSSDRCSRLLRYLLDVSLTPHHQRLKERTIGHEVFGRPLSYETSSDPVVRNAASEMRRRLSQYHHEAVQTAVRITMVPGSYVPQFHFQTAAQAPVSAPSNRPESAVRFQEPSGLVRANPSGRKRRLGYVAAAVGICLFLTAGWLLLRSRPHPATLAGDRFWQQALASNKEPLICVGGDEPVNPPQTDHTDTSSSLPFVDAKAYANIAGLFTSAGRNFEVKLAKDTNFAALRDRPVVLIGGFRNPWTMRLAANARFQVRRNDDRIWIEDAQHPGTHEWETQWRHDVDHTQGTAYALISRVKDPVTGGVVITLTGLGTRGTEVGSEFLSRRIHTNSLPKTVGNQDANVQLVVKTAVLDDATGAPEVVAIYVW